jgi:putative membrane protein
MNPGENVGQDVPPGTVQAHLAWLRTAMSLERTLDAWVRTAAALIGFGFTIVQFFERMNEVQSSAPRRGLHLAHWVGLLLIGIGTLALGMAMWQYRKLVKYLTGESFRSIAGVPGMRRLYPALTIAILLCVVGLLAFFAVLMRGY